MKFKLALLYLHLNYVTFQKVVVQKFQACVIVPSLYLTFQNILLWSIQACLVVPLLFNIPKCSHTESSSLPYCTFTFYNLPECSHTESSRQRTRSGCCPPSTRRWRRSTAAVLVTMKQTSGQWPHWGMCFHSTPQTASLLIGNTKPERCYKPQVFLLPKQTSMI